MPLGVGGWPFQVQALVLLAMATLTCLCCFGCLVALAASTVKLFSFYPRCGVLCVHVVLGSEFTTAAISTSR